LVGGAFQDELGVLPIKMATVTAARIFAARMRSFRKVPAGTSLKQVNRMLPDAPGA
jgi:hypothetical protein